MDARYIVRRTQIYLDEAQHAALANRARAEGTTTSGVIREAIDAFLRPPGETAPHWSSVVAQASGAEPDLPDGESYVDELRADDRSRFR